MDIRAKVDHGAKLDDCDIEYLEEVFADAKRAKEIFDRRLELESLAARMMHFYKEITAKALKTEQDSE